MKFRVSNEDGTSLSDYPKNPLTKKWSELYPPTPIASYSEVCDDYSCDGCSRCPYGTEWIVPEEDLEIWYEYQQEILNYHKIHNPILYNTLLQSNEQ